jgi:hypothetical protein
MGLIAHKRNDVENSRPTDRIDLSTSLRLAATISDSTQGNAD